MTIPTTDIIVPVWNQPFETRACLVSILNTSRPERLIIVNNGSNRETELMLEEFSDSLGERAVYMTTERNIGFVPAVNRALARFESDWAIILRSNSTANEGWFDRIIQVAQCGEDRTGIISPSVSGKKAHSECRSIETCDISFSGVMISRALYKEIGGFDEGLDGSTWCLRDFQQRSASAGYLTRLAPYATINGGPEMLFGSEERRKRLEKESEATVHERWGKGRDYAVYMPKEAEESYLENSMQDILKVARLGHRIRIFLHGKQHDMSLKHSWNCLHTGIQTEKIPPLLPRRFLSRRIEALRAEYPGIEIVKGIEGIPVPGCDTSVPFSVIQKITGG